MPKTLITAILILAAAAQPVVAAIEPCYCLAKSAEQVSAPKLEQSLLPACCAAKIAEPEVSLSSCCAKKLQAHVCSIHGAADGSPAVDRADCCCVKPAPAVPSEPTNIIQRTITAATIDMAVGEPAPLVPAPAVRRFDNTPGSHALTGPPLLAFLCVWRK
jgi:hypothetical protein